MRILTIKIGKCNGEKDVEENCKSKNSCNANPIPIPIGKDVKIF